MINARHAHTRLPLMLCPGPFVDRRNHARRNTCAATALATIQPRLCLRKRLGDRAPHTKVSRAATQAAELQAEDDELDADLLEALNQVSTQTITTILANNPDKTWQSINDLDDMRITLVSEGMKDAARFLSVLQGMLNHTVIKDSQNLDGVYLKAFNSICNAIQGSGWRLTEEGQAPQADDGQPKFSTWEEVRDKKQRQASGQTTGSSSQQQQGRPLMGRPGAPLETGYYTLLGLTDFSAPPADIKSAYRRLALKLHPDVNQAADAQERFVEISQAYDVLSDETSRRLYDTYGAQGMVGLAGAAGGAGNAGSAWDEFKPYKRENKFTKARDASRAASMSSASSVSMDQTDDMTTSGGNSQSPSASGRRTPLAGDIVEYPLSEVVQAELRDGRVKGLALLVGRNMDRGDAKKLPEQLLGMCEVEPLRQEAAGSRRWIADELSPSAYCMLDVLTWVPVSEYDGRFDVWVIDAPLSEGCGGPELTEEVMV